MNEHSSRSHSILQLFVEQRSLGDGHGNGTLIQSKLNLVDLAGSERWGVHHMEQREGNEERERIGEMTYINQSLSTLATVIAALSSKVYRSHIPYRDSKLTHLLQDSLGGNCKVRLLQNSHPQRWVPSGADICVRCSFTQQSGRGREALSPACRPPTRCYALPMERYTCCRRFSVEGSHAHLTST
jgi:hypothetical protein